MENLRDENRLEEARTSARRAAAKGERAAEAVANEGRDAAEEASELAGEAVSRVRSAGENAYEEVSEAIDGGASEAANANQAAWDAAVDYARGGWDATRAEIEKRPVRSTVIALAAGVVLGGILASRD